MGRARVLVRKAGGRQGLVATAPGAARLARLPRLPRRAVVRRWLGRLGDFGWGGGRQVGAGRGARGVLRLLLALLQAGGKALHKHERLYGGAGGLVVLLLVDGLCKCLLGAVAGEFDFVLQGL